jgi:hypothetical protein
LIFLNIVSIPNLKGSSHPFTLKGEIAVMHIYPAMVSIIFHTMKIKAKIQTIFYKCLKMPQVPAKQRTAMTNTSMSLSRQQVNTSIHFLYIPNFYGGHKMLEGF